MNSERDEAGDGPKNLEELDAPDLTGSTGVEDQNVWDEEEEEGRGDQTTSLPVADTKAGDAGVEDRTSDVDSASIAGPDHIRIAREIANDGQDSISAQDDTPPLQRTPTPSLLERPRLNSPRGSLRPFDRRFQAKRTSSSASSIFAQAQRGPGTLTPHSRTSSLSTRAIQQEREQEATEAPWEVVHWKRLGKLTTEVFSEAAKRKFGRITCMAVTSFVALGTSRGVVLIFDSSQQLKCIIGEGTKAVESGSVTAIAISADYTTVGAGHINGNIFTWEVARPAKPFLQILSASLGEVRGPDKDGHVSGVSVLHLGFLGVRHTALVSADDKGMAFSHLATRGMGALGRTVKTTRILGRYPEMIVSARPKKPSSVLGFSPMPMGTAEYGTDSVGLVAMLTPYLLVIVSTTPVAQTQHKIFRSKSIMPHSAMSGALAWYPAMQDESLDGKPKDGITVPKLAYCWSDVLQVLEVSEVIQDEEDQRDGPPDLNFTVKASWRSEEPLVALHWLSRNIIAALTISQQLVILEYPPLQPNDSCDLLKKNIHHVDLFSSHLSHMVEKLDDENANMHGVVADAYYMSFRAYKGRLFLLGFNEVSVGALSNWADRLVATMKHGDYVGAIRLATSYYSGSADVAAVGLPASLAERHSVVGEKLLELMSASLKYAFGQNPDATDQRASEAQLEDLIQACFDACESLGNQDFLFDEIYTWFSGDEDDSRERYRPLFFDALQTRVLEDKILIVPPVVLRDLVKDFATRDLHDSLEELLCRLEPATMDLDQVTKLCKGHELFDALLHVWSQGINDHTTIVGDILDAIDRGRISEESDAASKLYTFLSYTLTGRVYPGGENTETIRGLKAKAETYAFLFLGSIPTADGTHTKLYRLRQLLNLDTAAFMSMLNEAFEDPFLNGAEDREGDDLEPLSDEQRFGLTLNRQYVLDILLDFISSSNFETESIVFLDMFVARSVAKYPNDILLKGQVLHNVLTELCEHATEETAEDCQLSVEYLLSAYHPPDLSALIPVFHKAQFFRVIKSLHRSEGQFDKLLETCIEDTNHADSIFTCIDDCLRSGSTLSKQQRTDFRRVLTSQLSSIVHTDAIKTAATLDKNARDLHQPALDALDGDDHGQYVYLREIMEPNADNGKPQRGRREELLNFNEAYLRLLCDFDPHHVRSYVENLNYGDLKLESVLPALETSGMIDSAIVLMAREGQVSRGIERLVEHLQTLGSALRSLLARADEAPDSANIAETASDLLGNLEKYTNVGIWLCSRHGKISVNGAAAGKKAEAKTSNSNRSKRQSMHTELMPVESFWLELIDNVVQVTRNVSEVLEPDVSNANSTSSLDTESILSKLRSIVQTVFTALLRATTSADPSPRFLPILRAFLSRASKSSPSLTHLREVLRAIFSAYAFEEGILGLANQLLDKDLFVGVEEVTELRKRGWRPLGLACGGCSKKLWGPGAGREIWEQWYLNQQAEAEKRDTLRVEDTHLSQAQHNTSTEKGKGRQKQDLAERRQRTDKDSGEGPDSVVVFACRHLFHRKCLHNLLGLSKDDNTLHQKYICPLEA